MFKSSVAMKGKLTTLILGQGNVMSIEFKLSPWTKKLFDKALNIQMFV